MNTEQHAMYIERGHQLLRSGREAEARVAFLNAARLMYQLSKNAPDSLARQSWLERARRLQTLCEKLASGKMPTKPSSGTAQSADKDKTPHPEKASVSKDGGENSEEASPWELAEIPDVTFADIAGLDSVKQMIIQRVVLPLRNPELAKAYGRRAGAGIMMYGPPGTGKTMMAKAVAGELKLPFFSVQSSSILDKWFGVAEQNIKKLFAEARAKAPSVLFFDEAEALLCKRGGESNSVMSRVIPEFLAQVDGVAKGSEGLLLIGATNRPWDLDPATVRSERFGESIYIPLPDAEAREFLLRRKLSKLPGGENLDFAGMTARTEGFSGADINGLVYRIIDPVFVRAVSSNQEEPILPSDVEAAFAQSGPSVRPSDLAEFERYRDELESSKRG